MKLATVSAVVTRETFVRLLDIARLLGDVFSKRPQKAKKKGTTPTAAVPQSAAPTASPAPGNWTLARSSKLKAKEAEQPKETSV